MFEIIQGDSTEELAFLRRFGNDVDVRVSTGLTLLVGCLLVTAVGVSGAQSQGGQALAWDYPDHQVAEMDIVRFEIRFDGRAPVQVGMSGLPGVAGSYFTPLREMPSGQPVVEVRVCTSTNCLAWSSQMLFVVSPFFDVIEVHELFGAPF